MSTITVVEAVDTMMQAFASAWGNTGPIAYENKAFTIPENTVWCRAVVRHAQSRQTTLTDESGYKRFGVYGAFIVQMFFPLGNGTESAYNVSETLANALRKHKSQVTFQNVTWEEVGPDGKFFMFKLTAQFEYTQVR